MQVMTGRSSTTPLRLLVINPNTSQSMTDALKPMVQDLHYNPVSHPSPLSFRRSGTQLFLPIIGRFYILHVPETRHPFDQLARGFAEVCIDLPTTPSTTPSSSRCLPRRMLFPTPARSAPKGRMHKPCSCSCDCDCGYPPSRQRRHRSAEIRDGDIRGQRRNVSRSHLKRAELRHREHGQGMGGRADQSGT